MNFQDEELATAKAVLEEELVNQGNAGGNASPQKKAAVPGISSISEVMMDPGQVCRMSLSTSATATNSLATTPQGRAAIASTEEAAATHLKAMRNCMHAELAAKNWSHHLNRASQLSMCWVECKTTFAKIDISVDPVLRPQCSLKDVIPALPRSTVNDMRFKAVVSLSNGNTASRTAWTEVHEVHGVKVVNGVNAVNGV